MAVGAVSPRRAANPPAPSAPPRGRRHDDGPPPALVAAVVVSLVCHLAVLSLQLLGSHRIIQATAKQLDVVYESQAAQRDLKLEQQLGRLSQRAAQAPSATVPSSQIRIPDRASLGLPGAGSDGHEGIAGSAGPGHEPGSDGFGSGSGSSGAGSASRAPVIDLTNLMEAAQGDPVLLSYFSAIREQIQRTANQQTWSTGDQGAQGVIYLSFVLDRQGQVSAVNVLEDRSAVSRQLHDIALTIIMHSSPFPAFPPSLSDGSKTVVVPLEFLLGSG